MRKLSRELDGKWVDLLHPREYEEEEHRLVVGLNSDNSSIVSGLVHQVEGPIYVLYILHTPRGEGDPGRYQSPLVSKDEVLSFISKYKNFLSQDSRYNLWFRSPSEKTTIVWDCHDLVYCYGLTKKFIRFLNQNDYKVGHPHINFMHQHHYRSQYDADASDLLKIFDWSFSDLQDADIQ